MTPELTPHNETANNSDDSAADGIEGDHAGEIICGKEIRRIVSDTPQPYADRPRTSAQVCGMSLEESFAYGLVRSTAKSWCAPSSPLSSTSRLSVNWTPELATSSRTRFDTRTSPPSAWLATRAA